MGLLGPAVTSPGNMRQLLVLNLGLPRDNYKIDTSLMLAETCAFGLHDAIYEHILKQYCITVLVYILGHLVRYLDILSPIHYPSDRGR